MYGKTVGTLNVATGVSLLPDTGNSRTLFIIAASLLVTGVVVFVTATVLARKSRANAAN
jgi:hypothetical protein